MAFGDLVDLSLNEVEATALKAARGAGRSWAEAEAAAQAARWLACRGVEWGEELLEMLEAEAAIFTQALDLPWQIAAGVVPDLAPGPYTHWLLPALAQGAAEAGLGLTVRYGGLEFSIDARGGCDLQDLPPRPGLACLTVAPDAGGQPCATPPLRRSAVSAETLARLERLVQKTYVPTSEKSRLRGARPAKV